MHKVDVSIQGIFIAHSTAIEEPTKLNIIVFSKLDQTKFETRTR